MDLHIGSLIKHRAKNLRIGPTDLGKKLDYSKIDVNKMFKRQSVQTELLVRVSKVLDHNFFIYYFDLCEKSTPSTDFQIGSLHDLPIGPRVKAVAKENQIASEKLAEMINIEKDAIPIIYQRDSLDTNFLYKLSLALKHNFFSDFISPS